MILLNNNEKDSSFEGADFDAYRGVSFAGHNIDYVCDKPFQYLRNLNIPSHHLETLKIRQMETWNGKIG